MIENDSAILQELADAGWRVDSISALRTSGKRYTTAVPILSKWLDPADDNISLQEELVRALSVPWAKSEVPKLLHMFTMIPLEPQRFNLRWATGNALDVLWDDQYLADYRSIVHDKTYGRAREMVVSGLAKCRDVRARREMLLELVKDPDVNGHAISALAKSLTEEEADERIRQVFEQALSDSRAWVRKHARRGIQKLGSVWEPKLVKQLSMKIPPLGPIYLENIDDMEGEGGIPCRVCGLMWPASDREEILWNICACCGVEAGYQDTLLAAVRRYRERWIADGVNWAVGKSRPANWSLEAQMANIPAEWR